MQKYNKIKKISIKNNSFVIFYFGNINFFLFNTIVTLKMIF
jgi:hypothetical protein